MKKGLQRRLLGVVLTIIMITGLWSPAYAQEVQSPQTYSLWAVRDLFEAERMNLIPIEWYNEIQSPMDHIKLERLTKQVSEKLAQLGFPHKEEFVPTPIQETLTRGEILSALYNEVQKYNLPEDMIPSVSEGNDPVVSFMAQKLVLRGKSTKEYALENICRVEEAVVFASRLLENLYIEAGAGASGFLWEVSHNDNVVYLVGSIHLAKHDIYPFGPALKRAFYLADAVVVEANITNDLEGLQYMQSKMIYTDGTNIENYLTAETAEKLEKLMASLGVSKEQYSMYKPWALALQLSNLLSAKEGGVGSSPYAPTLGIDNYFLIQAAFAGKGVSELEGLHYQANMFEHFSNELQEEMLLDTLGELENPSPDQTSSDQLDHYLDLWATGNTEEFSSLFSKQPQSSSDTAKEYYDAFWLDRDTHMTTKVIEYLIQDGSNVYLVIAGAGHMVGTDGVIAQLESAGYTVTQVK